MDQKEDDYTMEHQVEMEYDTYLELCITYLTKKAYEGDVHMGGTMKFGQGTGEWEWGQDEGYGN